MLAKASIALEKILQSLDKSNVSNINIISEIEQSFLDYSMSVITSRALPDIKDGLKPVHRRIIFAAHQEGLYNNKKFKKSAALVGAVMGSYHPHGDSSIYEALARLSQDFNMRYPLIEGQGNFGSIDGDSPAAMRYTEVKLSKFGECFLEGIKANAVDFVPNYDGSKEEPTILPTILPNILLNGCTGIAVGLATNIPPHNLTELCNAALAFINNPSISLSEIQEHIKGPDFPTGGELYKYNGVTDYLTNGSGSFVVRSKIEIEEEDKKSLIVIKEIPYGIKKTNLINKIVALIKLSKDKDIYPELAKSIITIRDESNLEGIRLIIECKKGTNTQVIINNLFKHTPLQEIYSANITVLVDQQPRVLNIIDILSLYLKHQLDVLGRTTNFNLANVIAHIHILEGRKVVVDHLLEVIEIISKDEKPEETLSTKFSLSDTQLKDILNLPLRSIKRIEQTKLIDELNKEIQQKADYEEILANKEKQLSIIKDKLTIIKDKFGDDRRTKLNIDDDGLIDVESLITKQQVVLTLSEAGYISQIPLSSFKTHKRGGVGVKASAVYQDDNPKMLITCYSLDQILVFTNKGKVYKFKAYELGLNDRTDKGSSLQAIFSSLEKDEKVISILPISQDEYQDESLSVLFVTKRGVIKKTLIKEFLFVRCNGKKAFKVKEDDQLSYVVKTHEDALILLASSAGKASKFKASQLRPLGRAAIGVKGMRLGKNDCVVSASSNSAGNKVFSIGNRGVGKITDFDAFRLTKRGTSGVKAQKITAKTGPLLACTAVNDNQEILLMTNTNKINRFKISDVSTFGRISSGVNLFKMENKHEKIINFAVVEIAPEEESDSSEQS